MKLHSNTLAGRTAVRIWLTLVVAGLILRIRIIRTRHMNLDVDYKEVCDYAIIVVWSSPNRNGLTAAAKDRVIKGILNAGYEASSRMPSLYGGKL